MNINLLKRKNMNKFCRWLVKDNEYTVNDLRWWEKIPVSRIEKIMKVSKDNLNRDAWAVKKGIGHYKYDKGSYAYILKEYIKKRYERKKNDK